MLKKLQKYTFIAFMACASTLASAREYQGFDRNFVMQSETLSSEQCQEIYLELIENFVGWAEENWREDDSLEPGGGYFNAKGTGVRWARGNSNVCIGYAVLLDAFPNRTHFNDKKIPRAVLEDHLRRTLRTLALTYLNKGQSKSAPKIGAAWQTSLYFIGAVWAAHIYEDNLDADTLELIRETAATAADSLDKEVPSNRFGNTGSEDCAWNGPFLAFVGNKYSDDPRAENGVSWLLNGVTMH